MAVELIHNPTDSETLSAVSEMLETSFDKKLRYPFGEMIAYIEDGKMELYAAYDESELVGFSIVIPSGGTLYLLYLAVDGRYRSKGYGTAIVKELKKKYPDSDITLECEENLIPYYKRLGITETGYKTEFRAVTLYVMSESELNLKEFNDASDVISPLEANDTENFVWITPDGTRRVFEPGTFPDHNFLL